MTITKQLIIGTIFTSLVIVLPTQAHSMFNDYKQFRKALGMAQHFKADTSAIIEKHKDHILCKKYINEG